MDRGELEAGGQGAKGAGCACGTRRVASNPGGQGVLQGRGESSGRAGAATGAGRISGRGRLCGHPNARSHIDIEKLK